MHLSNDRIYGKYVGDRRGIRCNLYVLDVAFFAMLLYGSRYWLGCMHGTAAFVCSVFYGVEENRVSEKIYDLCVGWSIGLLLSNGLHKYILCCVLTDIIQ